MRVTWRLSMFCGQEVSELGPVEAKEVRECCGQHTERYEMLCW